LECGSLLPHSDHPGRRPIWSAGACSRFATTPAAAVYRILCGAAPDARARRRRPRLSTRRATRRSSPRRLLRAQSGSKLPHSKFHYRFRLGDFRLYDNFRLLFGGAQ